MIPSPPKPKYEPGTRVRVVQLVRVGSKSWMTQAFGTVAAEGVRPVGGMEMGTKDIYCRQPTLTLRRDDGELFTVALDENTKVEVVPS